MSKASELSHSAYLDPAQVHRGQKILLQKKDIVATQSFPKGTFITDLLQTNISNLGIKHRDAAHPQPPHSHPQYTDI